MLPSVLCITTNKYLVRALVVLLHAHFSVVSPTIGRHFFSGPPYIGITTVLPDKQGPVEDNKSCCSVKH